MYSGWILMMKNKSLILISLISLLLLLFISCESPLKTTLMQVVKDYSRPASEVFPINGEGLDKNAPVIISFTEPMETGSLTMTGTMVRESDGGIWSDGENGNNTVLTINPLSSWSVGSTLFLNIQCFDTDGYEIEEMSLSFGILDQIVYVHAGIGDDTYPGTGLRPKASIQVAVELADSYYTTAEVHVAEGIYNVDYSTNTHVQMKEGVSLFGGYSMNNWNERDSTLYESKIDDQSSIISTDPVPDNDRSKAVDCGSALTEITIIDGFSIEGGGGSVSIGINCESSNPTIQNNLIHGGSGGYTAGIRVKDSSPRIKWNRINGGIAGEVSMGIFTAFSSSVIEENSIDGGDSGSTNGIFNSESSPTIQNNTLISGGNGNIQSSGVFNSGSTAVIQGNTIHGGQGWHENSSTMGICDMDSSVSVIFNNLIYGGDGPIGFTSTSFGIFLEDSNSIIQNNTISGGNAGNLFNSTAMGVQLTGSSPVIQNNLIFTTSGVDRYGIFETGFGTHPSSLDNNDIFDCPTSIYMYYDGSPQLSYDINTLNSEGWASSNISISPLFTDTDGPDNNTASMDDNDWHLQVSTDNSIKTGGTDLSLQFTTDKDGVTRTPGWSIGAYEAD